MPTANAADATTRHITLRCATCGKWNRLDADRAVKGPKCGACGTRIAIDRPVLLTDETFDRVIGGTDLPVLVDFYADWCGPCKMMAPAVEALARSSVGRALIAKLDTDASPRVASRFQIRGIPTSIVFRGGREAKRQTGVVPLTALQAMVT
jgi:thioredoxin 2